MVVLPLQSGPASGRMRLEARFAKPNGNEIGDRSTSQSPAAAVGGRGAGRVHRARQLLPYIMRRFGKLATKMAHFFQAYLTFNPIIPVRATTSSRATEQSPISLQRSGFLRGILLRPRATLLKG
jgi:hypothetical protein